jgi:hypothetical protein
MLFLDTMGTFAFNGFLGFKIAVARPACCCQ